jgi:hypothetical protein
MLSTAMFVLNLLTGAGARREFGNSWNVVLALDVINTVIVLFYLWRIWKEKPGVPTTTKSERI